MKRVWLDLVDQDVPTSLPHKRGTKRQCNCLRSSSGAQGPQHRECRSTHKRPDMCVCVCVCPQGAASEASEGPLSSHASLSTAAERVQMKVQLQSIRQTLNTITTAVGHPSGPQSQPVKHSSAVSMSGAPLDPVEKLLMQISQQLSDVAGQVARVERREHKLSSSVHELQKICKCKCA